jgi:hypothetical protein|tara:strand:+ start:1910 stop:2128 length:219 start_codon:yes stop_codon:yes gene_type:complete
LKEELEKEELTTLLSDDKIFRKVIIEQNSVIIELLAQIAMSQRNTLADGFVVSMKSKYLKNLENLAKEVLEE